MPVLLLRWSLTDRGGGFLFFMAWLGASLGALFSKGRAARSIAAGALLAAGSCAGLLLAGREIAPLLLFCYGLGLGITMTAISLYRAEQAGPRRAQELNRLNLLWALGAVSCPLLATHALRTSSPGYLFFTLGALLALFAVWTAFARYSTDSKAPSRPFSVLPATPVILSVLSALIVGTEAALGGWLTTYAGRTDHSILGAVTAASTFWAGLLVSRALHSTRWFGSFPVGRTLRAYSILLAASLILLTLVTHPLALLTLSFLLGFTLGPLYPLLLAFVLARFRGNSVFLSAGLGSAVLPWLTGVLSSSAGSLRAGLAVPCAAGCALLWFVHSMPLGE